MKQYGENMIRRFLTKGNLKELEDGKKDLRVNQTRDQFFSTVVKNAFVDRPMNKPDR